MVVTGDLASADLQPPWWRGPVGSYDDVIKWKHFLRYWPFVRGIHRSPLNFPHKGQWRGALMFSLICAWMYDWENNREAGDSRWHHAHNDVVVMISGPNAGVAQREYWEWRLTFSFRYNVVLTTLCKLTNHYQIWLYSLNFSDAYASIKLAIRKMACSTGMHFCTISIKVIHFPYYWSFVRGTTSDLWFPSQRAGNMNDLSSYLFTRRSCWTISKVASDSRSRRHSAHVAPVLWIW